jgi:hypothetical protein
MCKRETEIYKSQRAREREGEKANNNNNNNNNNSCIGGVPYRCLQEKERSPSHLDEELLLHYVDRDSLEETF